MENGALTFFLPFSISRCMFHPARIIVLTNQSHSFLIHNVEYRLLLTYKMEFAAAGIQFWHSSRERQGRIGNNNKRVRNVGCSVKCLGFCFMIWSTGGFDDVVMDRCLLRGGGCLMSSFEIGSDFYLNLNIYFVPYRVHIFL